MAAAAATGARGTGSSGPIGECSDGLAPRVASSMGRPSPGRAGSLPNLLCGLPERSTRAMPPCIIDSARGKWAQEKRGSPGGQDQAGRRYRPVVRAAWMASVTSSLPVPGSPAVKLWLPARVFWPATAPAALTHVGEPACTGRGSPWSTQCAATSFCASDPSLVSAYTNKLTANRNAASRSPTPAAAARNSYGLLARSAAPSEAAQAVAYALRE